MHLDAIAKAAAEERGRRHAEAFAHEVVQCHVDGRQGKWRPQQARFELPDHTAMLERIGMEQRVMHRPLEQPYDGLLRLAAERRDGTRFAVAVEAVVRCQFQDHVPRRRPIDRSKLERSRERGAERDGFQGSNSHEGCARRGTTRVP